MKPDNEGRYFVVVVHLRAGTWYNVVDTAQPEDEQPVIIRTFALPFLANDFCDRHNRFGPGLILGKENV